MKIYIAGKRDINSLVQLWGELSDYHKNFIDYLSPRYNWSEEVRELFITDFNKKNTIILISRDYNTATGFIRGELKIPLKIFEENIIGYISDFYIRKEYRGTDLAENFMMKIIKWFRVKGASDIRLNVNSENMRAIKFYEKCGFEEVSKSLKLKL